MGEAAALFSALTNAITTIIIRSQADRYKIWEMSATLGLFASIFYATALWPFGQAGDIWRAPAATLALGVVSGLLMLTTGSSLYIKAIQLAGVARAFPTQMSAYSLFTMLMAVVLFHELVTWTLVLGVFLVLSGVYALAGRGKDGTAAGPRGGRVKLGLVLCVLQGLVGAVVTLTIKVMLQELPVVALNAIRFPAGVVGVLAIALATPGGYRPLRAGWQSLAILGAVGLAGWGLSSLSFVYAVLTAGAAKTAILASTAPLFALPLTAVLLKEKVTVRVAAGTLSCVSGIGLIVS